MKKRIYFHYLFENNLIKLYMGLLNELKNINDKSKIRSRLISYYNKMELPKLDDHFLNIYPNANLLSIEKNVRDFLVEGFILFLKFIKKNAGISDKRTEVISNFLNEVKKPTTFHSDNSAYRHLITIFLEQYEKHEKTK